MFFVSQKAEAPVDLSTRIMTENGVELSVLIADTTEEIIAGLSGVETLSPYDGMLFVFEEDIYPGFWMKDMKFPIDIVWIDNAWVVDSISENVATSTYPQLFYPQKPIRYVLEMPAGVSQDKKIMSGSRLRFLTSESSK